MLAFTAVVVGCAGETQLLPDIEVTVQARVEATVRAMVEANEISEATPAVQFSIAPGVEPTVTPPPQSLPIGTPTPKPTLTPTPTVDSELMEFNLRITYSDITSPIIEETNIALLPIGQGLLEPYPLLTVRDIDAF